MAARASWKGNLEIGDIGCAVALYTAVASSERLSFNIVNRKTGIRVERQFVDSESGKPVGRDDQIKGYETADGRYILLEPEELAELMPKSDKVLTVSGFVACEDIDKLYFDRPYHLAATGEQDTEALHLLAEAMAEERVAAIAEGVLFRRNRSLLIRPDGAGAIIATTLNFDYEVRSAAATFKNIPEIKFDREMLDLARHIISTKSGSFRPEDYHDRYDAALVELVKAKMEGRKPPKRKAEPKSKVIDLMEALRQSAQNTKNSAHNTKTGSQKSETGTRRSPGKAASAKQRKAS